MSTLTDRLDDLLTQHLLLLDKYTTLRDQFSSQFSSAFLSLAAANRNAAATLGAGRRFGADGFDGRMKAGRRVAIGAKSRATNAVSEDEDKEEEASVENGTSDVESTAVTSEEAVDGGHMTPTGSSPSSKPTTGLEALNNLSLTNLPSLPPTHHFRIHPHESTTSKLRNPLHWYTPLPPPSLRQTQTTFAASLDIVTALINTTQQLNALDQAVRDVRLQLHGSGAGIDAKVEETEAAGRPHDGAELTRGDDLDESEDEGDRAAASKSSASKENPKSSRSRLSVGSTTSPRSRVLKMR